MWYQKPGNKYHAHSTQYEGITYHSKKEAAYAQELDLRVRGKDIKNWERQIPIELRAGPDNLKICTYYVDFLIHHKNGDKELVEIKGFETDLWRMKRKLLEALWLPEHPEYSYTVIK